jgi:hypothetical protein
MTPNRLPLVMFAFIGLVVVAVIGMLTASWVWFGIALAVHLIGTTIVMTGWARSAQGSEQADPESERLDRHARDAVPGDDPRNVETELEALKREPAQRL